MYKKRVAEGVHDSLIKTRIIGYRREGHTDVRADHLSGYNQPEIIGDHIPDITSKKEGKFFVTEAETKETIGVEETAKQWQSFSMYTNGRDKIFHVVVPESCLKEAKKFAEKEGIRVDRWFYNPMY
ncbi:MAG: hypothetical protein U5L10_02180 [Candidatus Moranbacteria bacterium]|nr:hypothetical protein [Candidatus Moranbacteria bacterium]